MGTQKYTESILNFIKEYKLMEYAFKVIAAILILIIGGWLIKKVVKISQNLMDKKGIDITLQKFLGDLISWTLKILVFITAISQVGVETTSFIAIVGAAGLAIGGVAAFVLRAITLAEIKGALRREKGVAGVPSGGEG